MAFTKRIYPYFKPYQIQCLSALAALFAAHVVEVAIPVYLQKGIDLIAQHQTNILWPAFAIFLLTLLRFVFLNIGRRRNALLSTRLAAALRQALYEHLLTLGREFYARFSLGDLMARATNDIAAIQRFFRVSASMVSLVSIALIAPVYMLVQSPLLSLLLLPFLLAITVAGWFLAERIRLASERLQADFGALTETVQQNLKGIRTIQSHGQEAREIEHFTQATTRHRKATQQLVRCSARLNATMLLGSGLMTLIVVGVGGNQVLAGQMSVGTLTAFVLYLAMILSVVKNSSTPIFQFLHASTAAQRVFQIMDEKPELEYAADILGEPPLRGLITFSNVTFSYPGKTHQPPALQDITLTIEPGEIVAIIGTIGAGKSTLLRLLARQLEPSAGHIALDGRELKSISLNQLRSTVSFVTQDSFLFATSMAENISFDQPERPLQPIWDAARAAQLEETIKGFSAELSTRIGERGVMLSGGQQQRTSLARSLIRQTPILLLDDSFSALDTETAASILSHLQSMRQQLTTIMVTHQVAAARFAGKIYVLECGRIVETGRHQELLALNGHYARLLSMQHQQAHEASI